MAPWLLVFAALGADRVHHAVDEGLGLPVGATTAVAQDSRGFLWAGTQAGAARYDGERYEGVGLDVFSGWVEDLAPLPDGGMVVAGIGGPYLYDGGTLVPHPIPDAGRVRDVCAEDSGEVLATDGALLYAGGPVSWRTVDLPEGVRPWHIRCEQGRRFLTTPAGLWEQEADGSWSHIVDDPSGVVDVLEAGDGALWILPYWGAVIHLVHGEARRIPLPDGRHVDLELRRGSLWVSSVRGLTVVHPDGTVETMDRDDGWRVHGALTTDAEGGLWVATKAGLDLLSEPDAAHFDLDDGLADELVRRVSVDGVRVWASAWGGFSSIGPEGVRAYVPLVRDSVCVRDGQMWGLGQDYRPDTPRWFHSLLVHAVDGRVTVSPGLDGNIGAACALDESGQPWFAADGHLQRVEGEHLVAGPALPEPGGELHDSGGDGPRLWWLYGERACRREADAWRCVDVDGADELTDALDRPDGSTWLASRHRGVVEVRFDGAGPPSVRSLGLPVASGVNRVLRLAASPRGGVWVNGVGFTVRADHTDRGWQLLETLRFSQGLDHGTQAEVVELDDGTLWIASYSDLIRLPPSARTPPPETFPLLIRELTAGGDDIEPDDGHLPWRTNQITLRVAALTYRDRRDLRFRARVGPDAAWLEQPTPTFQFAHLAPGPYRIEVQASTDGDHWTPPQVRAVSIAAPPWRRWWAWLAYAGAIVGVGYAAHRVRVRQLLAVERERQRIALDLHDELGSGLSSIGLGAGLLAHHRLPDDARSELAERLGSQASDMSTALSEIVWSLRQGPVTADALLEELELRARALLQASETRLLVEPLDADADARLPPDVARGVLLIGLEALHNAARHADADEIRLRLVVRGGRGLLEIADDGVGLGGVSPQAGGGNGLGSMRRRASRLGCSLRFEQPGRGTVVRLEFELKGSPEA